MGAIFSSRNRLPGKPPLFDENDEDSDTEEKENLTFKSTNVQEIECCLEWNLSNWRSLTKAKVSEARSPLFKIKVKGGGKAMIGNSRHDYIHRFKLVCQPEYKGEGGSVSALVFQLKPIFVDSNKFEEMRRSNKFEYEYGKYAWYAYKSDGYFDIGCRGLPMIQSGALAKCDKTKLVLNCEEIPEKLEIVSNLTILRTDHF